MVWDREADEIRITDPADGLTRHFATVHHAEEAGQIRDLTGMSDRSGNTINILRTADGTPTGVETAGYRIAVDTAASEHGIRLTQLRLLDETAPDTVIRRFGYDERGRLTEIVDGSDMPFRHEYDENDRIEVYDPNGFVGRWTQAGRVA